MCHSWKISFLLQLVCELRAQLDNLDRPEEICYS